MYVDEKRGKNPINFLKNPEYHQLLKTLLVYVINNNPDIKTQIGSIPPHGAQFAIFTVFESLGYEIVGCENI